MKKLTLNKKLLLVEILVIGLFLIGHLSPSLAIRTHLFFSGHPLAGISCQLTFVEAKSDSLNVYELSEAVQEKATGSVFTCYEVTHSVGILYFAKAQGQA